MRSAAQSALRVGFHPLGADLFVDADLTFGGPWKQVADYPAGLARWLDQTECDGWIFTGGLENYPALVATMATRRPLLGCGGEVLQKVRSPGGLAAVLEAAGLRFPKTVPFPAVDPVPFAETGERWLVKTCRSSSGMGVRPLTAPHPLAAQTDMPHGDCYAAASLVCPPPNDSVPALVPAPLPCPKEQEAGAGVGHFQPATAYLQQYIDGCPCAALFLARDGQAVLLGLTRQLVAESWTGAAPFQYCGSIGPHPRLPASASAQVERIGEVLAKAFNLVGLFGVDLIIAGSQVWTIEVNPRYTAAVEIVERVAGMPLLDWHIRACQQRLGGQEIAGNLAGSTRSAGSSGCHGKAILFARQRVTVERIFTEWALKLPCRTGWPLVADIPRPGTVIGPGQPVVTLFAAAESLAEVEEALRARVAQTQRKLYGANRPDD